MSPARSREVVPADYQAVYEELMPRVIAQFNAEGKLPPMLLLTHVGATPGSVEPYVPLDGDLVQGMQQNAAARNTLMLTIHGLLHGKLEMVMRSESSGKEASVPAPDLVVHITESWVSTHRMGEPPRPDAPRGEGLMCALHSRFGSCVQICLVDPVTRQAQLAPFDLEGGFAMGGRFQIAELDAQLRTQKSTRSRGRRPPSN